MKKDKFIFLDFDGCLNSCVETPGSYLNHTPDEYGPSLKNVYLVRKLAEDAGAMIVISSNWRKFDRFGPRSMWSNGYKNPLSRVEDMLGDLIYGTLPVYSSLSAETGMNTRIKSKSEALVLWLMMNGHTDSDYVIFDDDHSEGFAYTDEYGIKDHYVEVDPWTGITEADCKKALQILNSNAKKKDSK